jgi:transcriptional regulator with XRE-family HTH domain
MKPGDKAATAAAAGTRIRKLREAFGMTRETFGARVSIEPRALGNYETGLRQLPPEAAIRIAGLFGLTLDWIYWGRTGGMPLDQLDKIEGRVVLKRRT